MVNIEPGSSRVPNACLITKPGFGYTTYIISNEFGCGTGRTLGMRYWFGTLHNNSTPIQPNLHNFSSYRIQRTYLLTVLHRSGGNDRSFITQD